MGTEMKWSTFEREMREKRSWIVCYITRPAALLPLGPVNHAIVPDRVYLAAMYCVHTPKILDDWAKQIPLCEPTHLASANSFLPVCHLPAAPPSILPSHSGSG